ncbi:MAG: tRNA (adenosine(37)-N6)-threonylcarbamoyltransferase complex dimerization subunit type 1 TsaB [Myxococcota bacterium]
MRILGIDTCGPVIAVGVTGADGRLRQRSERVTRGAEARLIPWAVELCAEAGFSLADLDGVAVAAGPGAFTGLRVGLAAGCGVAMGANCLLWTGSSLASRAWSHLDKGPVLSMLDARKSRVYAELFGGGSHGAGDVPPEEAVAWSDGPFVAVGEGAIVYRDRVIEAGGHVVDSADEPGMEGLLMLARVGFETGEAQAPELARPVYLRAPDAKIPKSMQRPSDR